MGISRAAPRALYIEEMTLNHPYGSSWRTLLWLDAFA
jgi:hypothetical protein